MHLKMNVLIFAEKVLPTLGQDRFEECSFGLQKRGLRCCMALERELNDLRNGYGIVVVLAARLRLNFLPLY